MGCDHCVIEECSVLSTCARFDFIFVVRCTADTRPRCMTGPTTNNGSGKATSPQETALNNRLGELVARNICKQHAEQSSKSKFSGADEKEITSAISSKHDLGDIIKGLCLMASGLAARPDRPTGPHKVMFKPFSSSDSHIMMQLKRLVEIISTSNSIKHQQRINSSSSRKRKRKQVSGGTNNSSRRLRSSGGRIRLLLNGALRAGKAARNEAAVPEILQLKPYAKNEDEDVPLDLMTETVSAVNQRVIFPSVEKIAAEYKSLEANSAIASMRRDVFHHIDILTADSSPTEIDSIKTKAKKLLHGPTLELRSGESLERDTNYIVERYTEWVKDQLEVIEQ